MCSYRKNDGDDVAPLALPGTTPATNATQAAAGGLVFLDPSATGSAGGGAAGNAGSSLSGKTGKTATSKNVGVDRRQPIGNPNTGASLTANPAAGGSLAANENFNAVLYHLLAGAGSAGASPGAARSLAAKSNSSANPGKASTGICPYCRVPLTVTNTATPQRICFNFPICLYTEKC